MKTDVAPPPFVVAAFGGDGSPVALAGGTGTAWRAGSVVLKTPDGSIEELAWQADLFARIHDDRFRLAIPLRTPDGSLTVDGWWASTFLVGGHKPGQWGDIVRAGESLHEALAEEPRPEFLDHRTDPWAIGDRVAWGELPAPEYMAQLASALRPVEATSQLIHGDLTGNVLFAEGLPPGIIDFSPYWRPAPFAAAIVVADALVWEGAGPSLLAEVAHIEQFGQYLLRALIYRMATDGPKLATDPYQPAIEIALRLADR